MRWVERSAVAMVVGLASALVLGACGSSESELQGLPEGDQFVNEVCTPNSVCLRCALSPSRIPADDVSQATMGATLVGQDGGPIPSEEICFRVEDPGAATIVEPVGDACQFTNEAGNVSGRVRAGTIPTSVRIRYFTRLNFGLECQRTLILGDAG